MNEDIELQSNLDDFGKMIKSLNRNIEIAVEIYIPDVNTIINDKITDNNRIENLLDRLLDYSINEKGLKLFKELCRYYYNINPKATTEYISLYKELYNENLNF